MAAVKAAGKDRDQRAFLVQKPCYARGGPMIVDGDDQGMGMAGPGGTQDTQPRAIAETDLEAKVARGGDRAGVGVDDCQAMPHPQQGLADHLTKSDEENRIPIIFGRGQAFGGKLRLGHQPVMQDHEQRRHHHRQDDDRRQGGAFRGGDQVSRQGGGVKDKGELAALGAIRTRRSTALCWLARNRRATAESPMATPAARSAMVTVLPPGARNAIIASRGTMARSSSSKIDKIR